MELSRVEQILKYYLGEADTLPQPLSRVEELLIALGLGTEPKHLFSSEGYALYDSNGNELLSRR